MLLRYFISWSMRLFIINLCIHYQYDISAKFVKLQISLWFFFDTFPQFFKDVFLEPVRSHYDQSRLPYISC